jgi:hypothetical protein
VILEDRDGCDVIVPDWMFDILVLFRDDREAGGCCGWDGDPEGRRDTACIQCAAWEHGERAYWGWYFSGEAVESYRSAYDPEGYARAMLDAGRGHLVGVA